MDAEYYLQFVEAIDECNKEVQDGFEMQFIEDMLTKRPQRLSEKQKNVIRSMARTYLGENVS
jgi:hypothetical protein